jgi:phosphinothricin acetyltransferase
MPPVHTRAATVLDAESIATIYNQGIEDGDATFETDPRTAGDIADILRARGDRYPYVVAERSGCVVAWAGCGAYRSRPCYAGVAEFSVYVERAARGTGAGKAALAALVQACEARGFWKLVSRIFPENQPSRALCASLGFREVGLYRRHGMLRGRWRDCVIVERLIGAAAAVDGFHD